MELGLANGDLVMLVAALLAGGLVAGFLAGLLGIGGGGVLVPVLYEVFRVLDVDPAVRMHVVLGTCLAIILPTSLKSFAGHRARGSVDMALLKRVAPFVVLGVMIGAVAAKNSSAEVLKWVWAISATVIAFKMAFGRESWRISDHLPPTPWPQAGGFGVGFISTLMSIGGASFVVPLLTLFGKPILQAVSTAAGVGPLIAFPGVIGYAWAGWGTEGLPWGSIGYVNLLAMAIVAPVSVLAAPLGVRMAHRIPRRTLELAFAAFLATIALRFIVDLVL
ncbi:sulfite exporter TauE/SafE family protein [Hyphomicrobium sulfonivorans]|uniref:sulfite exporter TauE/SafE family protein n=1 Tax=Hyphomicrobium sulfonivorans TaxID=121290 RepID=UPI00156F0A68|nr:sulfite exporter TauE/SafE family protein [Hyphomicrobium sulfonivorans]MBI1650604.1 sulfite exporter TauE/SafE family protein [Hyphomicrobium sulfonivorans]NSL72037.1 sulfite exporter TauE/SafE family protein [Hyphomicrobium sulfonivorans]